MRRDGGDQCPVVVALSLRARPSAEPLPGMFRQARGDLVGAQQPGPGRDAAVAADAQHVPDPVGLQFGAQHRVGAVYLVTSDPPRRDTGVQRAGEHPGGQRGLGRELDVGGHAGLGETVGVGGPGARQVERVSTRANRPAIPSSSLSASAEKPPRRPSRSYLGPRSFPRGERLGPPVCRARVLVLPTPSKGVHGAATPLPRAHLRTRTQPEGQHAPMDRLGAQGGLPPGARQRPDRNTASRYPE